MAIDKDKLNRLHRESLALLEELADRFDADKLKRLRTYSFVGEWGLLMESICATLIKRQIPITPAERDALAAVLALSPNISDRYPYWHTREQTLASLNVVESL